MSASAPTFLVTGISGDVGQAAARALIRSGLAAVRGVSREHLDRDGAFDELCVVDLQGEYDAAALFDGVAGVLMNSTATATASEEFLAAAHEHGVEHVVLISSRYVDSSMGDTMQRDAMAALHRRTESLVEASGIAWTHLRADALASNARWDAIPQLAFGERIHGAYPDATSPVVHPRDVGEVAAAVLLAGPRRYAAQVLEVTGPESISERNRALMTARAVGRHVAFVQTTPHEAERHLAGADVTPEIAQATLLELRDRTRHPSRPTTTVRDLLGREACTYEQWLSEHLDEIPLEAIRV